MPDDLPTWTEESARRAVEDALARAGRVGHWEAICPCGQSCGMQVSPSDEEPIQGWYVACPACPVSHSPPIVWVWTGPDGQERVWIGEAPHA